MSKTSMTTFDDEQTTYKDLPVWKPQYPSSESGGECAAWLNNHPHRRAALPQECGTFTALAIDEDRRSAVVEGALENGVIARVAYIKPYAQAPYKRTRRSRMPVYQLTDEALEWFDNYEPNDDFLPCDCETDGFVNVGVLDSAPSDEDFIACKQCGGAFPKSQIKR